MARPRVDRSSRRASSAQRPPGPLPPPLPATLLERPLDYLLAEHHRHRSYLAGLRYAATLAEIPREQAARQHRFLASELPLHWADEERDLFPILRRLALPEDGLAEVLARLSHDHAMSEALVRMIDRSLSTMLDADRDPVPLERRLCGLMLTYTASETRHLAIENAVVLAIAGVRLRKAELKGLSAAMKARREASHVADA
jgi:hemerythrin-like domain-containing protein